MRVAVTGSSGLIGTALRRSLAADGHEVLRVVRRAEAQHGELRWDPMGGTIDAAGLAGVDAVVHLAGAGIAERRWTEERKRLVRESRTRATALLANALAGLERKPAVLVSGSAIGIYGDRGDETLDETASPGRGFLAELVQAWEAAAAPAEEAGIRVARIRTGLVLSRDGGALTKLLPLFRLGLGGRFGSGRQWWSWISIDDEVGAIRFLLDHEVAGPVNLTAPQPVTNAALAATLGRVLRRPAVLPVPQLGPALVLGRELARELLYQSQRVVPGVLTTAGYSFRHPDLEGALRALLGKPGP